jgi:hypothetical protein
MKCTVSSLTPSLEVADTTYKFFPHIVPSQIPLSRPATRALDGTGAPGSVTTHFWCVCVSKEGSAVVCRREVQLVS